MSDTRIVFPTKAIAERFMPTHDGTSPIDNVARDRTRERYAPELVWWPLTELPKVITPSVVSGGQHSNKLNRPRLLAAGDWVLAVTPYDGDIPDAVGLVPVFRAQTAGVVPVLDDADIKFPITAPVIGRDRTTVLAAPIGDGSKMAMTTLPGDWSNAKYGIRFVPDTITPVTSEETT